MRKTFALLVFIIAAAAGQAQISWSQYSQTFSSSETPGQPLLIAAIPQENDAYWSSNPSTGLRSRLFNDTAFSAHRSKNIVVLATYDRQDAQFFVRDITTSQNGPFEYRVLRDGKEIVKDWSPVNRPSADSVRRTSTIKDLMYIGGYKTDIGHYLLVDLRNRNSDIVGTSVVIWPPLRPLLFNIYTPNELNGFLQRLSHPEGLNMSPAEHRKWQGQYGSANLDPVTGLPKKLSVPSVDNNLIFVLKADIRDKAQVQYELVKDGNVVRPWAANEFDNNFIWLKELGPGNYILRMRYTVQPDNALDYPFEIKPPPGHSTSYIIGISSLIAAFFALVIVGLLLIRQKRRTRRELARREKLELEMKGLKAQLNPHFIFNSLSSIQGLVNMGKVEEANEYISVFARLMRDTLNLGEAREVPLQREVDYLDAYLRLERLRFNFDYSIRVDSALHTGETGFPPLLLQPLAENAVRHGRAREGEGRIELSFDKEQNDLKVTVRDNGKGFEVDGQKEGYGLHLTRQRIRLINDAAGGQIVRLGIYTDRKNETRIELVFKGWLHEA